MGNAHNIGDALLASPQVRKITFTRSTVVGKKLMAGATGTGYRLNLVVMPHALSLMTQTWM